jgi:Protein of unknown function (DUF1553)
METATRRGWVIWMDRSFAEASTCINPNCEVRTRSTVAPQALLLMNDPFVLERANDLALRLRQECPGNARQQIVRLWELAFAQVPSELEIQRSLIYLAEQTEALRQRAEVINAKSGTGKRETTGADPLLKALSSLCQVILGSNRFLYLD